MFLRYWREMNEGDARWTVRAAFSSPGVGEWEAYMYLGDWAYGSSAERFDVRLAS